MDAMDVKSYLNQVVPLFDSPDAARREACEIIAAVVSMGTSAGTAIPALADYLHISVATTNRLALDGLAYRSTPPPTLRAMVAADFTEQAKEYARFLVQVTRLACLQFGDEDPQMLRTAGAIAAAITRFVPVPNAELEPKAPGQPGTETPGQVAESEADSDVEIGEALDELEALVGLERVKSEINQQVQLLRIAGLRSGAGLKNPTISRHLVFVGNPGTGKTTVARIVGRIYRALDLVSKGHLVETDASGLVAGYVGQTAIKTQEQIANALGGILFIDEAYGLTRNQFGVEAIDTLVKGMEDHRDDLVVIVAGYPANMEEFIGANPGLESRFPTTIVFEDYTAEQLQQIFASICAANDYLLDPSAGPAVVEHFAGAMGAEGFGNAREARNLFERAVRRHAWRLKDISEVSVDQMKTLQVEDVLGGPV